MSLDDRVVGADGTVYLLAVSSAPDVSPPYWSVLVMAPGAEWPWPLVAEPPGYTGSKRAALGLARRAAKAAS